MNNEFNNSESEKYAEKSAAPKNINEDTSTNIAGDHLNSGSDISKSNLSESNITESNIIETYITESNVSGSGNDMRDDQANNTQSQVNYSIPGTSPEKKPKKKRRFLGAFKLVAAAMAFGLIAGAAFQGFYMVAHLNVTDDNNLQVTEVADTANSGDTIIPVSTTTEGVVTDVSDVVSKVMPSIVAINSTIPVTSYDFFGRGYSEPQQASGSGIIVQQSDSELLIVTNNHVIDGAESVDIVFSDGSTVAAEVKGADANTDLAVLSVKMSKLSDKTAKTIKVATLGNSDKVQPGEMAIAIGNALGYGQSVTVGYISAVNREVTINDQTMTLLQTDAAINPGNSGGALLNAKGEVIGINSVKYASEEVEGMGYSIPISSAIPMIKELISRQVIATEDQGFLGVNASTAQDVTDLYSQRFNMPVGVYVNDVIKGSPAENAGLVQGDIITGLDGTAIKTIEELKSALSYKKEGQKIELVIQTKEKGSYVEKTLTISLGNK